MNTNVKPKLLVEKFLSTPYSVAKLNSSLHTVRLERNRLDRACQAWFLNPNPSDTGVLLTFSPSGFSRLFTAVSLSPTAEGTSGLINIAPFFYHLYREAPFQIYTKEFEHACMCIFLHNISTINFAKHLFSFESS